MSALGGGPQVVGLNIWFGVFARINCLDEIIQRMKGNQDDVAPFKSHHQVCYLIVQIYLCMSTNTETSPMIVKV